MNYRDFELDEERSKIMVLVFVWAYRNGIDVTLASRAMPGYGDDYWPELTFRSGQRVVSHSLFPLTALCEKMRYAWKQIAIELCVEPLELP